MRPLRVMYISWRYPKLSETFVQAEVTAVRDAGHHVQVVSILPSAERDGAVQPDVVLRGWARPVDARARRPRLESSFVTDWGCSVLAGALVREARAWRPDILHCHFINKPASVALRAAAASGIPCTVVAHARDWRVDNDALYLGRKVALAAHVFAISEEAKRQIALKLSEADRGALATKISVVRAASAVSSAADAAPEAPGSHFVVVARLVPKKGIDVAISAIARLSARTPDARLVIVGDGPERAALEELARKLQAPVEFRGAQPHKAVQELLAAGSGFVLPCRYALDGDADGIPVVLMEAANHGLPVITTPIAGIPELVTDSTGYLVPPENPDAICDAMFRILKRPDEARAIAQRMRLHVSSEFAPGLQAQRLGQRWRALVESRAE